MHLKNQPQFEKARTLSLAIVAVLSTLFFATGCNNTPVEANNTSVPTAKAGKIRLGISPFQDTLLPILGSNEFTGIYQKEGLEVEFKILGWTEVQEALAAGQVDVAINNCSSVVATWNKRPSFLYWYGLNTFDDGFALMIRPNSKFKTVAQLTKELGSREKAIAAAAQQLKGRTVVTTANTDMEQGVAAFAKRGGLDFKKDIKITNLAPEEGVTAFLSGTGDAFIGGVPQRTRAAKQGMVEMVTGADLGPAPINGFVTTKEFASKNQESLLKLLHGWFQIVNYVEKDTDKAADQIVGVMNKNGGSGFTSADFKKFWQHYEHYPLTAQSADQDILQPTGRNYWRRRWDDCNDYFFRISKAIPAPVKPEDAFGMVDTQKAYIAKFGSGTP